jgi:hypothetical protein
VRSERLPALAALLLLAACRGEPMPRVPPGRIARAEGRADRSLLALVPESSRAGEIFRPQPNGEAGLVLLGTGLTRGDAIVWNGLPLKTTFGHSRLITASVPVELLEKPGEVEILVEDAMTPSRAKLRGVFRITP